MHCKSRNAAVNKNIICRKLAAPNSEMNTEIKKKSSVAVGAEYIKKLSDELGLHPRLVELLAMRGINGRQAVLSFLHPDTSALCDPFSMKGMKECVARIRSAMDAEETVVVYGDYDVDGVCASAILSLCFKLLGKDVIVHIPDRMKDGYGLSVKSIESIIEEHNPDLIITCDCGISGVKEVEHCRDLGVDIIVTDHHEPGAVLPDCVIVNPKQPGDEYPEKYLCGAGVALKLVQALAGDVYEQFLDIAAVATVADIVPLLGENRLIVQLGLRRIADGRYNLGLRLMLKSLGLGGRVTSSDIAFRIAPRINAAGRMGDAYRAFEILTSGDEERIRSLIKEIDADNERRRALCDSVYEEAKEDLAHEDISRGRAIVLCNPEWSKGVTGIAAARFAGEYNRPTFIIVDRNENGVFKGTARGIKGVNVFEALTYCSDLLTEFGGHSGAAGFSVEEKNIPLFRDRINEYLAKLPDEYFLPCAEYDLDISVNECDEKLLSALEMLEPTGSGNEKPLLRVVTDAVRISPCKNPVHTSVQIGRLQAYAFSFYDRNQYLIGSGRKEIVFELSEGLGGGVSAYIKAVNTDKISVNDEMAQANFISLARYGSSDKAVYTTYKREDTAKLLPESIYGTLFICADGRSYERILSLGGNFVTADYMTKAERNNYSGIIVAPITDGISFANYSRIVFADRPPLSGVIAYLNSMTDAEIFIPEERTDDLYSGISGDRAVFASVYSAIIAHVASASSNVTVFYKRISHFVRGLSVKQFAACFAVFCELGFLTFGGNELKINGGVRRPLTDSRLYAALGR